MRHAVFALILAVPAAAQAQTPREIAHLLWNQEVPAYASAAPLADSASAGAASGLDIARQLWRQGAPVTSSAPRADSADARSFTGADLDRLRGASTVSLAASPGAPSYRTAAKDAPHG